MSDPFPAVTEAAASGETAELFADIRATVGVRVVNLVWRHLATFDGALPWAWQAVRPLYEKGIADRAVLLFRRAMVVPRLASLEGDAPDSVDAVLASYDHSNTINLFALGALVAWLREEPSLSGRPLGGPRLPAPDVVLPKLADEADVAPETWQRVLRLNRLGDTARPVILASMYRHLAHAPDFLERLEEVLTPAARDGALRDIIVANRNGAYERARVLAQAIEAERPDPAIRQAVEPAVAAFLDHAIGKMVTICRAIRTARAGVLPRVTTGIPLA